MPTRVLLEGPAIEPLLEQVRREYGTSVRIISADKVRTGGFGGFFAKQKYELSVEVPDDVMAGRQGGGPGGFGGGPSGGPGGFGGGNGPSGGSGGFGGHGPSGGSGAPEAAREKPADTLAALLERADQDGFGRSAAREQQTVQAVRNTYGQGGGELPARAGLVSTASPAFAEVMAGLESGHLTRSPAEQRTVTAGAPAVTPSAPSGGVAPAIDVPLKPAAPTVRPYRPPAATSPDAPPPPGAPMVSPALLEQLIAETNPLAPAISQPKPAPPPMSTPMATATMAPEAPIIPAVPAAPERSALVPVHPALPAVPTRAPEVVEAAPMVAPRVETRPQTEAKPEIEARPEAEAGLGPIAEKLVRLGMPRAMAARATGTDAYGGVLEALADLPARPAAPGRAGDVLVVAGELSHALPVARRVVEQLRLDASRLLLAGPSAAGTGIHPSRKISGPNAAEKKARKIHRGDTPYVVVLDAPVSEPNEDWVRDVCDAIGATEVWAAVDATRKTADTLRHLRSMGDVDAVAVYGAAVTEDPASVLGLDVPIFTIDGQDASPHAWAAMLCARMTQIEKKSTRKRRR